MGKSTHIWLIAMSPLFTCGCTDGGDVIALQVVDDVIDSLDSFLGRKHEFVVVCAKVTRHLAYIYIHVYVWNG